MQGFHEKSGINTNGKNSPNDGTGMRVNPSFSWGDGLKPGRASGYCVLTSTFSIKPAEVSLLQQV